MLKQLKCKKSPGLDGISNERLIHGASKLLPLLIKLFNKVLDTGEIPNSWGVGKIIPLFKCKGSVLDPNNYRGITVLSCLGKLFTGILNNRLSKIVHLHENQAGFRAGYSTADHVFVLRSLIDIYLHSRMKLFCGFVDFQKAFDTVWHTGLWKKLIDHNVTGKVFKCIFNMYQNIKSCVVTEEGRSEFFSVHAGVRQGENLSPLLFAIYVNDLESFLERNGCQHIPVGKYPDLCVMLKVLVLLYADDTVLLSSSAAGLQKCLDALAEYCYRWKLKVNVEKTKVIVIGKRKVNHQFTYEREILETVDQFKYLGVVFSNNGKYTKCIKHLYAQGLKAMYSIIRKGRLLHLPVDVMLHLFDVTVVPIILYTCEVWGSENCAILEKIQLKFCKHILGLKSSTPNCMVYGETGQYPLQIVIKQRLISYWAKIITRTNTNALVCESYKVLYALHTAGLYTAPWLEKVRTILCENGFADIWLSQNIPSISWLKEAVKLRLRDQYQQEWHATLSTMPKCVTYRLVKDAWGQEQYLVKLPRQLRISMCKFRTCNHKLATEKGRYQNIPRHERFCTCCNANKIGDEFHFLFECRTMTGLRAKFLSNGMLRPQNVLTFGNLMNTKNYKNLLSLANFIHRGLKLVI